MASRDIPMNNIMEAIREWHKGKSIRGVSGSLGMDRKTMRKYLRMAKQCGVVPECSLEGQELADKLSMLRKVVYKAPAMEALANFRSDIEKWLKEPSITIKEIWRRLVSERKVAVQYASVRRYLMKHFPLGAEVTVRIITTPRYVGKRIREEIARLPLHTYVTGEHHLSRGTQRNDDYEWMKRLMQGTIGLDELTRDIGGAIPSEDTGKLYECVLRRPVRFRNRAISFCRFLKEYLGAGSPNTC